tara:strand:+ start:1099 stop:1308 length:210 start_codon:yes stop_codon:yes gene_type:complete
MKISQHIEAGQLTYSFIGFTGKLQLSFGDDEVHCDVSEEQLRELCEKCASRIAEINEKRQEEFSAESDS